MRKETLDRLLGIACGLLLLAAIGLGIAATWTGHLGTSANFAITAASAVAVCVLLALFANGGQS